MYSIDNAVANNQLVTLLGKFEKDYCDIVWTSQVPPLKFLLLVFAIQGVQGSDVDVAPSYDGVLRATTDGRAEAYLIPPFPSNHASNFELLPSQDILVTWFSGSKEGASGVAIVMSRLQHGARVFQKASIMSQRQGYSNQNPVIFYDNVTNHVYLFHSQQKADEGETTAQVWAMESNDSLGNTWSQPMPLFTKPGSFDRNRVMKTLQQTWLLPIYYSLKTEDKSSVQECLHQQLFVDDWEEHPIQDSNDLIQPSIIRSKPDEPKLLAFFRDENNENIYRAESGDDGRTWSSPTKTTLPNNDSGIQACGLKSGNIAMVYNPTRSDRNPLVISLSEDGGQTWRYTRVLQSSSNSSDEFSYPSILQTPSGQIHISHTYLRQTIKYHILPSEDWIKNGTRLY